MRSTGLALGFCLLVTATAVARADPVDFAYFEPATDLRFGQAPAASSGKVTAARRRDVGFSAFGRNFELVLERNDRLLAGLAFDHGQTAANFPVYKGSLQGLPGSWVRMTLSNGTLTGAIWDGAELFLVDAAANLGIAPGPGVEPEAVLVLRAEDVRLKVDAGTYNLPAAALHKPGAVDAGSAGVPSAYATSVERALPIGLVLDAEFFNYYSNGELYALAVTNVVDGLFVAQLALHLDLEYIDRYDSEPDPFNSTQPDQLLQQLANLKGNKPDLRPLGLVHLLTRIRFEDDDTLGFATLGRICQARDGVGLTRAIGGISTALIMAHEIGHNFGAEHDGEAGSACASTSTNFIMSPTLNDSRRFSSCSISSMQPVIGGASCLTGVDGSDVELLGATASPREVWYGEWIRAQFMVNNIGSESTILNRIEISTDNPTPVSFYAAEGRLCPDHPALFSCELGSIFAGDSLNIEVSLKPLLAGQVVLDGLVTASNDSDPTNNSARLLLEVNPATDIGAAIVTPTYYAKPGDVVRFTAGGENYGDFETSVMLELDTEPMHRLSATSGCTQPAQHLLVCDLGMFVSQDKREIAFDLHTSDALVLQASEQHWASVNARVRSSLHDLQPGDNELSAGVTLASVLYELGASYVEAPGALVAGETRVMKVRVENGGPDPAENVSMDFVFTGGVWGSGAVPQEGSCTLQAPNHLLCVADRLAATEAYGIEIPYSVEAAGRYVISWSLSGAGGFDTDYTNNFLETSFDATHPPPPVQPAAPSSGGGGGGGSTSWLLLLLLALLERPGRSGPMAAMLSRAWRAPTLGPVQVAGSARSNSAATGAVRGG